MCGMMMKDENDHRMHMEMMRSMMMHMMRAMEMGMDNMPGMGNMKGGMKTGGTMGSDSQGKGMMQGQQTTSGMGGGMKNTR